MKLSRKMERRYFTLTELMVVIVILVMLASLAAPLVFRHIRTATIRAIGNELCIFASGTNITSAVVRSDAGHWWAAVGGVAASCDP